MRAVKAAPDGWMTCDLSFSRSSCGGPAPAVWALLVHDLHPDMQGLPCAQVRMYAARPKAAGAEAC